jgi:ankyrin repeat protein
MTPNAKAAWSLLMLGALLSMKWGAAAAEPKVDFVREVASILRDQCVACHGPDLELGDLRLDQKQFAFEEGGVIKPGDSRSSLLIKRLAEDKKLGIRMPPTGPALDPAQIAQLTAWIDQGAEWPEGVELASSSGEERGDDKKLATLFRAIWEGDAAKVEQILDGSGLAGAARSDGMTPLIYAAFFSSPAILELLLKHGADPNAPGPRGLTPLIASATNLQKVKALVARGANVHAESSAGLTALRMASREAGNATTAGLLLEQGAKVDEEAVGEAIRAGDHATLELLISRGGSKNAGLGAAIAAGDGVAVRSLLEAGAEVEPAKIASRLRQPLLRGNLELLRLLADQGVDFTKLEEPPLLTAADSEFLPVHVINFLLDKGLDPHVRNSDGHSALTLALRRGRTPVVDALESRGAQGLAPVSAGGRIAGTAIPTDEQVREAADKGFKLLQSCSPRFFKKTGCFACHHQLVTSMGIDLARMRGLTVNEEIAETQRKTIEVVLKANATPYLEQRSIPGSATTTSFMLASLADERFPGNEATAAMVVYLLRQQRADGSWIPTAHRPPSEYTAVTTTAYCVYAIDAFAPPALRSKARESIARARQWLLAAPVSSLQEHASRLLGLKWAGAPENARQEQTEKLFAQQREDGGWAQLPTLGPDAYATGLALYALHRAGGVSVSNPAYRKGVTFLVQTQLPDGSWHVRSRSQTFQPYFESGFPHEHDQWISAHATGLAAMSLMFVIPESSKR